MNMIIRILFLPLSLSLVAIAGVLASLLALLLVVVKAFDNSSFSKVKKAEPTHEVHGEELKPEDHDREPYSGPTIVKH